MGSISNCSLLGPWVFLWKIEVNFGGIVTFKKYFLKFIILEVESLAPKIIEKVTSLN